MGRAEVNAEQLILLSNGLPSRYKVESILGTGGMGIVLAAQDLQLSRKVAIKVLQIEGQNDTNVQARFASEAKALASLDHPNIVKLLTWGMSESGNPYLVLELVQGEALSEILERQGKLTPRQFQQIFSQVLAGLRHAHEHNIVHRDLKPGNLIVTIQDSGEMIIKIIDFGVAKFLEPGTDAKITSTLSLVGSPAYMSPEQCKGHTPDFRSDIYSLACIMYQGLTGRLPFEAENSIDLMYKHTNADWSLLESLIVQAEFKELASMIDRSLSKDPQNRPQSLQELAEVLNRVFARQSSSNKLFILKGEKKQGAEKQKFFHTVLPAALLLIFAVFCITHFSLERNKQIDSEKWKGETQSQRAEKRKNESSEQRVKSLKRQIGDLERDCKLEQDKEKQKDIANSIVKLSRHLGKEQADLRKHQDAAIAYSKLITYSQYQDVPAIARADTYRLMSRELAALGKYNEARELSQKGIDELKESSNDDGDTIAFLLLSKTENDLYLGDFSQALIDFREIETIWSKLAYVDPSNPVSLGAERDRLGALYGLFTVARGRYKSMSNPKEIQAAQTLLKELASLYSSRRERSQARSAKTYPQELLKNTPEIRETFFRGILLDNQKLPQRLEMKVNDPALANHKGGASSSK